jgi:FtsP/CotA-like multicopper oxidase with cupredoxin domain
MKNPAHTVAIALGLCLVGLPALAAEATCPRPQIGSEVKPPPDLFSQDGKLELSFNYFTDVDEVGRTLFCFVTPDGMESPTLHVRPGDRVTVHLTDQVPAAPLAGQEIVADKSKVCGSTTMTASSVNLHFHGLNITPRCHGDETIHTLVNSGETFDYTFRIPDDEPPGLYWYHPHVHGISSQALQGGASGLIEVEGIANLQPVVAGLPERYLILRDEQLGFAGLTPSPFWDVSVNYVTVPFPTYPPAIIKMQRGTKEFWRVANAAANTIMDIKVLYDGVAQPLQIVAFDGVPTGSQDGKHQGVIVTQTDILLSPAARAEFIVKAPRKDVKDARLITEAINGGPSSDSNPKRPLAIIQTTDEPVGLPRTDERTGPPNPQRFAGLAEAKATAQRTLYFYEIPSIFAGQKNRFQKGGFKSAAGHPPTESMNFYITVDGQFNVLFDPDNPPAIVTHRGAVEEWTIQNRTAEVHEFHIHQVHFLLEEENGVKIPKDQQQFYDTHQVDFWNGDGPYPYIKVKMDFRGPTVGDFVYHCHILDHEDGGMMAIIRVKPKKKS